MKTLIRTDSSSEIGIGHVMRDILYAGRLKDRENISFACLPLPGNISHRISRSGFNVIILNTGSAAELADIINRENFQRLIIDHYGIDADFERELKDKTGAEIIVFDDTYEQHHADVLINPNYYADEKMYKDLVPESCELRCGEDFVLIRDEFAAEKSSPTPKNKVLSAVVAMGGADNLSLNPKILSVLSEKNIGAEIITTTANAGLDELRRCISANENFHLHIDTNEVGKIMNRNHFAVISASTTSSEAVYLGLPFIAVKTADNQKYVYKYLIENGYCALDGFSKKEFADAVDKIIKELK